LGGFTDTSTTSRVQVVSVVETVGYTRDDGVVIVVTSAVTVVLRISDS